MAGPSYPPPNPNATPPTCAVCGSTVYCGGPLCPSASLPLSPDGASMVSTNYTSVAVNNPLTGQQIPQVG